MTDDLPEPGRTYRIPPASGVAFVLKHGQTLRIIDPQSRQVCDLFAVMRSDVREAYSSGRSLDYADRLYLTTGDVLYSNRSTAMLTLLRDDVARHDLTLTPCSPEMFVKLFGDDGRHPSCFGNLAASLARFGVSPETIACSFNIFMDVRFDPDSGKTRISPPPTKPGDVLDLRAEADLYVGLTACSSENSNGGSLKPIDFVVDP